MSTLNQEKFVERMSATDKADRPKLRFGGFEGVWEEKKLGEVAKFWNGKAHEQDISENGKYVVVNSKFISQEGRVKKYSDKQISPLKKDDITIVMSDIPNGKALGKCFLIDEDNKYTLNQRIGGIRPKGIDSLFLFKILNRNKYFLRFDNGVSQTNLRKSEVLKCSLTFPSLAEQKKIAGFLGVVDEWIGNLKGQKVGLVDYKRGVMQGIFSGGIGFRDGNGDCFCDWEERKLGEVAKFLKGKNVSKSDISEDGKNKCIRYGELYTEYNEVIDEVVSKTNLEKDKCVLSENNDMLMPTSDVTPNGLATASALCEENIILGGDILIIRSDKIFNKFFSYYVLANRGDIMKLVSGVTVYHIYASDLKNLKIQLPSLAEQERIADFLCLLDDLIQLKQEEIDKAERWKRGLMQGLFV